MSSPRIFFVNRFYWPDEPATAQLLTDLTRGLAARGWDVAVIASRPEREGALAGEAKNGVVIERVWTTRLGRRSLAGRMLDFISFYLGASWRMLRRVRRGDVIVALTDPPLIGVLAGWLAAVRGARLVHWVQDIYPEVAGEVTGHHLSLALRPWRNRAWRRACACVVPGTDMARALSAANISAHQLRELPNWAPAQLEPAGIEAISALRREWKIEGQFVLAYSGNLGRVHDLEPILDVAMALRDEPGVIVAFIGGGAQRPAVETAAQARRLTNVRFFPAQPREQLAVSLGVGDVHFVTLRPGADRWVFPSKLYGIAAVGRPTLFIGARDCEIARLVRTRGIGASYTREEVPAIVAQLREWRAHPARREEMGIRARQFAANGAALAVEAWHNLLTAKLAESAASG